MKKTITTLLLFTMISCAFAQQAMSPEMLVQLGKLTVKGITKDGKSIIYTVKKYSLKEKKSTTNQYIMPVGGGNAIEMDDEKDVLTNDRISPDGRYSLVFKDVKLMKVYGKDYYPDLDGSNVMIYNELNDRHWDTWEDGAYGHVFIRKAGSTEEKNDIDINMNEHFDCPQKPFGGDEDCIWSNDGKQIIYVSKKKSGKDYALSTNTDIYSYSLETQKTTNLTEGMMGYDMAPAFSKDGTMAWLSMKRDGYEADKNDIIVNTGSAKINLTAAWDGSVEKFKWSKDGKQIFFIAAVDGTLQVFTVNYSPQGKTPALVKQISNGDFDVNDIVGQVENTLIVTRTDMNHAAEIYSADITKGEMKQLTHINDAVYNSIRLCRVERRYTTTTDNKKMLVWIIYPPDFDKSKKYPTLLYCQGGPQSPLTQFYSFRWNFQLMASNGYIVVAPNRRGMYGHGVKWNEEISKDYNGQVMKDYLSAIDDFDNEPFVDKARLGCVGASFGGYSSYYLAGNHEKRFKTFIAHDGLFDLRSMYGTTEELWFINWDLGGAYWDKNNAAAQNSFDKCNPINYVEKWDTPILIIQGGKDYRVSQEQGLEAFQAAQLKGLKSRMLYFPTENHWVLDLQNSLVWQREFFKWLKETLD